VTTRPRPALPVRLLQWYAVLLVVIPSNTTFTPVGAAAFPAGLLGVGTACLYVLWVLMGTHRPLAHRYPTRTAFVALWATSLVSYLMCQFRDRSVVESNGADRWLLFLAGMTGVALVAAEGLRSMADLRAVLRALTWAGAVCGVVAALQFWLHVDLAAVIGQSVPGFSYNGSLGGIQGRGGLNRVPGTTLHPIELGAVTAMLLPIALVLAITDRERGRWSRYLPVVLIAVCVPVSVSRSAILAILVACAVLVCQLRAVQRALAMVLLPFGVAAVFLAIPGLVATLSSFFVHAGTDTSISTRTDDYPLVESLVRTHPWFGAGGGTYLPTDLLTILDNSYLKWVVEFGLVGLAVLVVCYLGLPVVTAVTARRRARSPESAMLAAAFGAALTAAAVSALTFDALAFPTFACLQALVVGLTGALWQFVAREQQESTRVPAGTGDGAGPDPIEGID
jgi:O-antigen ligase